MAIVAILAADLGLVLCACRSDVSRGFAVTLGAVVIQQFRGRCSSRSLRFCSRFSGEDGLACC